GLQLQFPAAIKCTNQVTVMNATGVRVRWVHFQKTCFLQRLESRQVGKSRIQEIVCLARQQLQREGFGRRAMPGFRWRNKARDWIEALRYETLVMKQCLAARRSEVPLGKWQERFVGLCAVSVKVQPNVAFFF